jgi:curli biogenesis system outer membrane secretion channel CsgG
MKTQSRIALLLCSACSCAGSSATSTQVKAPPPPQVLCQSPSSLTHGVAPAHNKTGRPLQVDGVEDLLSSSMIESKCFTLVERDQVTLLVEEMKLCTDLNPDSSFFKCDSFAKKGNILGIRRMVFSDVIFFEDSVRGAELSLKVPGIGGIEAGRTYAALSLSVRVVDVESGKVITNTVVHALTPSDRAGLSVSVSGGADIKAMVSSRTPMGEALHDMINEAVKRIADTAR